MSGSGQCQTSPNNGNHDPQLSPCQKDQESDCANQTNTGAQTTADQSQANQNAQQQTSQDVVTQRVTLNVTYKNQAKERQVNYDLNQEDSKGNLSPLENSGDHKFELKEDAKGDTKGLEFCQGQCVTHSDTLIDRWVVTAGNKGYSVTKRFYMDDKQVRILDPSSHKAYDWQRVTASYKEGFTVTYGTSSSRNSVHWRRQGCLERVRDRWVSAAS